MNGILGTWELLANINQAVYFNSYDTASVVVVNLCNRGNSVANVRIAVSSSLTNPSNAEWFVFDQGVSPKETFEKTGITISPGKYLIVRASSNDVNVVCYGLTNGSSELTGITRNFGNPPTFTTSTTQTVLSGQAVSIQLATDNEAGETVTYSLTSGSLPAGLTLSSSGLISGTVPTVGYPSAPVVSTPTITATDSRTLSTPQIFNITRRWNDGSTALLAAPNAQAIKAMTGTTSNAAYWIDTGSGAVQTFCLMSTATGYMLAAKIASTSASATDWGFFGSNWTRTSTLNEAAIANNSAGDAVGRAYYEYRLATGFAMALNSVTNVIAFNRTGVTPREALAGSTSTNLESQLSRSNFMTWINNAGTASSNWDNQPNSNRIRLNSLNEIPAVGMRFGITMNNEADDLSNDSAIGFGTFTNNDTTGIRNIAAGGHRWNTDQKFPHQGFIFVA
jgi:hypothetical protein